MQSPEVYLNQLNVTVKCAVDSDRDAILDVAHRVFVNWETFYFSSEDAQKRFQETPERFAGKLTNPVTRKRFELTAGFHRREHDGRTFYFPDASSLRAFDSDPSMYATPMIAMRPVMKSE